LHYLFLCFACHIRAICTNKNSNRICTLHDNASSPFSPDHTIYRWVYEHKLTLRTTPRTVELLNKKGNSLKLISNNKSRKIDRQHEETPSIDIRCWRELGDNWRVGDRWKDKSCFYSSKGWGNRVCLGNWCFLWIICMLCGIIIKQVFSVVPLGLKRRIHVIQAHAFEKKLRNFDWHSNSITVSYHLSSN